MQIFVGNLSFKARETDVQKLFEEFGSINSTRVIMDKRGRKSRGFGFVDMPDESQAQAAIDALNNKEFMGRPLNISSARPKTEQPQEESATPIETKDYSNKNSEFKPNLERTGEYKRGRRSISYIKRRALAGIDERPKPSWKNKNKENPMRWRKKSTYKPFRQTEDRETRPWHKSEGESKPWRKTEHSKFWQKPSGESMPAHKSDGESRTWRKPEGRSRPYHRSGEASRTWRKPEGGSRPYHRSSEEPKPWRKPEGGSRPSHTSGDRPQRSSFKGPKKPYASKNRPSKSRHI